MDWTGEEEKKRTYLPITPVITGITFFLIYSFIHSFNPIGFIFIAEELSCLLNLFDGEWMNGDDWELV